MNSSLSMQPTIRPYRCTDVEAVALLFTDSVHHIASRYYDDDQCAAWAPRPPNLQGWAERLVRVKTLVAEADMKLAGFISYEQSGHIDLLYTSPAQSRRGIASVLYRKAEADLAGGGISELFTEASLVALPFFERFGFRVVEERHVALRGATFRQYVMRKSVAGDVRNARL